MKDGCLSGVGARWESESSTAWLRLSLTLRTSRESQADQLTGIGLSFPDDTVNDITCVSKWTLPCDGASHLAGAMGVMR
jgi:hypothetical protein